MAVDYISKKHAKFICVQFVDIQSEIRLVIYQNEKKWGICVKNMTFLIFRHIFFVLNDNRYG